MNKPVIYTIGHSTHPIAYFLELLKTHHVNCVVDVRSMPASRFNPQYNKKSLTKSLNNHGIAYLHFGEEFGARQTDPALLDNEGRVDFEKMRASAKFQQGIARLQKGCVSGYTIALMCSEAEPLHCHRFSMISFALTEFDVRHILKDKSLIEQVALEDQMLKVYTKKLQPTIFHRAERPEKLAEAYKILSLEVAYSPAAQAKKSSK